MIRRLFDARAIRFLESRGYSSYIARLLWKDIKYDLFCYRGASLREKLWCYRHGFLSERLRRYGLNVANVDRYLPDFAYKRMHPINGKYSRLIDNKLDLRHLFVAHAHLLPKYYYHTRTGKIRRLADCPFRGDTMPEPVEILSLLERVGALAAKPSSGSGGLGFIKLEWIRDQPHLNGNPSTTDELNRTIACLDDYIFTEYLTSHIEIQRIYDRTPNTLRLVVINPEGDTPVIIGGFMRFGLKASGSVDNAGAGAIFCGIDLVSGRLHGARRIIGGNIESISGKHPDTGKTIDGFKLPNWEAIKSGLVDIGLSVPQLIYMGYDIVITQDGFKFIEINSLPDIQYMQPFAPIFDDEHSAAFFKSRIGMRASSARHSQSRRS